MPAGQMHFIAISVDEMQKKYLVIQFSRDKARVEKANGENKKKTKNAN